MRVRYSSIGGIGVRYAENHEFITHSLSHTYTHTNNFAAVTRGQSIAAQCSGLRAAVVAGEVHFLHIALHEDDL